MKTDTIKQNHTIRFDESELAQIQEVANMTGMAAAAIIRLCVKNALPVLKNVFEGIPSAMTDSQKRSKTEKLKA